MSTEFWRFSPLGIGLRLAALLVGTAIGATTLWLCGVWQFNGFSAAKQADQPPKPDPLCDPARLRADFASGQLTTYGPGIVEREKIVLGEVVGRSKDHDIYVEFRGVVSEIRKGKPVVRPVWGVIRLDYRRLPIQGEPFYIYEGATVEGWRYTTVIGGDEPYCPELNKRD